MNLSAFEKASGLSANWVHLFLIVMTGGIIVMSGLGVMISIVMKLRDPHGKFHYDIIIKICGLIFIVALIFGVIASM